MVKLKLKEIEKRALSGDRYDFHCSRRLQRKSMTIAYLFRINSLKIKFSHIFDCVNPENGLGQQTCHRKQPILFGKQPNPYESNQITGESNQFLQQQVYLD